MKCKISASWGKAPGGGKSSNRNIKLAIKRQSQFKVFHMQKKNQAVKKTLDLLRITILFQLWQQLEKDAFTP